MVTKYYTGIDSKQLEKHGFVPVKDDRLEVPTYTKVVDGAEIFCTLKKWGSILDMWIVNDEKGLVEVGTVYKAICKSPEELEIIVENVELYIKKRVDEAQA